jgi:hypothetical protein
MSLSSLDGWNTLYIKSLCSFHEWCPFRIQKENLATTQLMSTERLSLVSTHVESRWRVPLNQVYFCFRCSLLLNIQNWGYISGNGQGIPHPLQHAGGQQHVRVKLGREAPIHSYIQYIQVCLLVHSWAGSPLSTCCIQVGSNILLCIWA